MRKIVLLVLSCVCGVQIALAAVTLPAAGVTDGVRYGADRVAAVFKGDVVAAIDARDLPASPEAFALEPQGKGYRVVGATSAGLQYGLLELADRVKAGDTPRQRVVSAPKIKLRGDTIDFPFYLGVDLYNGRWRGAQSIERSEKSWWFDHGHWAWYFRRCADLRINSVLICHPHPFPALISLPGMPEAAYFPPAYLKKLQENFKYILNLAQQYGVKVYLLTWNIWVSPGFAKAHHIAQEGTDSPLVREYTRRCYERLCETYPKLAGIMTIAGEAPPGCVDFVKDAIVAGLNAVPHPPELLFWTWCCYPEDAKKIFAAYKGPKRVVHYLQYEQLFRPQADPRIKMTSEALGGIPVVTLGGLGTATGWFYWSDPYYIRDIMADLPRQNGDGCFFGGLDSFAWKVPKWLGWAGLARYWWDPAHPREDKYWQARIAKHYGMTGSAEAEDFLRASISASKVLTRQLALLHRQTDHFEPQFGLPLVAYLGLPTLSTYVFENYTGIDAKGRLTPRLGLTWPNPDWGEKVRGVVDFVAGKGQGTTPLQIADELEASGRDTLTRVARLRRVKTQEAQGAPESQDVWARCMDQMEMNGHLGLHTADKIRAAVAWQRWRTGKGPASAIDAPLAASVDQFEKLAAVADRLYKGSDVTAWRICISRPIPWNHLAIWNTDRYRHVTWDGLAAEYRRELEWVRAEVGHNYSQPILPFEDDLVAKPAGARLIAKWDFEGKAPRGFQVNNFPPDAVATIEDKGAPAPLVGKRLVADSHSKDFWFPLQTDPKQLPLESGKTYYVTADYWIDRDAEKLGDWLQAGARTTEGGWRKDVGARYMGGPAGTRGRITLRFTPRTWKDYYVYVSIHGPAKVEIDNVEIWEGK